MTWHIGQAAITRVSELDTWRFIPTELFAAWDDADSVAAARLHPGAFDRWSGEIVLSIHAYLIELGGTRLLIDAGNGDHKSRPALLPHHMLTAGFPDRLRAAGVEPDSIDLVVATHLHPDHCGGFTVLDGDQWVAAFPRAEYVVGEADLAWLRSLRADAHEGTVAADLVTTYVDSIEPVAGAIRSIAGPTVLAEAAGTTVSAVPAPGHSPGHLVVRVDAPGEVGAVFVGDLVHHPLQLEAPHLLNNGDADPQTAARTRQTVLEEAARGDRLVLTAHFPVGGPERVGIADDRLQWRRR